MVNHQTFDWIFFAIVGIPFVLGLLELLRPELLESLIRDRGTERSARPVKVAAPP